MRFLTDELCDKRNERHFGNVIATRKSVKKDESDEMSAGVLKLLITFALTIGITLVAAYGAVGMHPGEGKRSVNELISRGYIRLHKLPRKGKGGQPQTAEVLKPGIAELTRRGITPAKKRIERGGFIHELWARVLEEWTKSQGAPYWFERTLGVREKKAFDFVYELGGLHAIEIMLTGKIEANAEQLIRGAAIPGIASVTVACEKKTFLQGILKKAKAEQLELFEAKIEGKMLTEFIV